MGDQLMGTNVGATLAAQYSYPDPSVPPSLCERGTERLHPDKFYRAYVGLAERALIPMARAARPTTQISLQSGETQ